ncbi:hypothetical protein EV363DRAFT_1401408 [Boletus edulis]|uniref:Uncharacterized protein n=1 Tax=Boletus edulis BED1 TaxID=1328754 RepID=A0AAD4G552_BOLED|nr:hypothetical protein EV363DRAFT_1401408 [Boletus edulis]KAF8414672.1 hypothetical protein L210DRAFT_2880993 [Boletus edulis BED1]
MAISSMSQGSMKKTLCHGEFFHGLITCGTSGFHVSIQSYLQPCRALVGVTTGLVLFVLIILGFTPTHALRASPQ